MTDITYLSPVAYEKRFFDKSRGSPREVLKREYAA
jgi:hypothetical protein